MTDEISKPLAVVVLAAGKGTRMLSDRPKVLQPLAGAPMLRHVLAAVEGLRPDRIVVVVAPGMTAVAAEAEPWDTAIQAQQRGTGDAVRSALPALGDFAGDLLVVFGDAPLVTTDMLRAVVARARQPDRPGVTVMGVRLDDPAAFGRLVMDAGGTLAAIVEYADADAETRALTLCNGGAMLIDGDHASGLLSSLSAKNAQGEIYLTDLVAEARRRGFGAAAIEVEGPNGLLGVNSKSELAEAERVMQTRLRDRALAEGVTLLDPGSVHMAADTRFGRDVTIEPHVIFGPGVTVGDGVTIRGFSHIEGATIGAGAVIGPFARLRPGTLLGAKTRIGNFVETKNAVIGAEAKANHLSYLGDAEVGAGANIGAGTITCNYDGYAKHRTRIGAGAFIGSNTALVAPVHVSEGAIIGAGSVIGRDVDADALAVARAKQVERPGWAAAFRKRQAGAKADGGKKD